MLEKKDAMHIGCRRLFDRNSAVKAKCGSAGNCFGVGHSGRDAGRAPNARLPPRPPPCAVPYCWLCLGIETRSSSLPSLPGTTAMLPLAPIKTGY